MRMTIEPSPAEIDEAWAAYRRDSAGGAGIVDHISFIVMRPWASPMPSPTTGTSRPPASTRCSEVPSARRSGRFVRFDSISN